MDNWTNTLVYGPKVLKKTKEGGAKRNLTNEIKNRIANCDNDVAAENESLDTHQKPRKVNSEEQLAKATTAKLEDGDFKAALRLICSEVSVRRLDWVEVDLFNLTALVDVSAEVPFQVWKPEMHFSRNIHQSRKIEEIHLDPINAPHRHL